ncbi:hypothetical protein [Leptothoe sp. PORK10 BA2]|uniref:hypothetical protein n=1 Tax=Leptothoe sp. PORK10 BA2 TaxID=3110254 RepID=UPI002B1EB0DE|nr:hypothetical protein [Leptothoe sp. PORK10 BA2]MEA5463585.1 hypothetical protein [Leptothoe sp. PORK10 BA2]
MPVAACKLLTHKGQYSTCYIKVPDVDAKLPAIKVDGHYYSLFRRFGHGAATMKALGKLAQNGDQLALIKQENGSYTIWAWEADAQEFKPPRDAGRAWPTHGPATCLMLGDAHQYHQCYVQVPDLALPIVAIHYTDRFYSVYQPALDETAALELAAQLTGRGNDCAIASTPKGFAVCLWEPEAMPKASSEVSN